MNIDIIDEQTALAIDPVKMRKIVHRVLSAEGQRCDEVALHFVSKEAISELHALFFDDPSPTDCISMPIDEVDDGSYRHLGEVFVCPEIACEYALLHEGDSHCETVLYVVHGLLHLLGYDDLSPEEEPLMRQAEERLLADLTENGLLGAGRK